MPVTGRGGARIWQLRDRRRQFAIWAGWLVGTLVFVQSLRFISGHTIWEFAMDAHTQAWDLATRMVPPRWSYMEKLWVPLWDTLNIATLGTLLGTVIAFPVAFLAARNTTPSRALARPLALLIIVSSRSINSLIWALLLVTVVGPGVLAGIIAIALRSIGFVGKLLYEAIEETDPVQVEAIVATGATRPQQLAYGVLPQILPAFAGITVYRWDINIRESTVLGLVGAGGIGLQLNASVSTLAWPQVTVIFIAIFITVVISEWLSARVRHAII
jgi:phosphonate transport system permease protein